MSLLYGILNRGEAYLIPTWLMQEQRLAQVKINQSINQNSSRDQTDKKVKSTNKIIIRNLLGKLSPCLGSAWEGGCLC